MNESQIGILVGIAFFALLGLFDIAYEIGKIAVALHRLAKAIEEQRKP